MSNIIQFKKPRLKEKHKGRTLCKSGFHKWEVVETPFDVKKGKSTEPIKLVEAFQVPKKKLSV